MALATPRGMRDILPEEALWREHIKERVERTFAGQGYLPVETPVLEQRDLIDPSDIATGETFRLFDRDGAQLVLRPDVTLPIARMVSARMGGFTGPVRLRYAAPVFCETDALRGESRQYTQLGVELIGASGVDADAEVLSLADRALVAAGITGHTIVVGSVQPMNALLSASGMPASWCAEVRAACRDNDLVRFDELVAGADALEPTVRHALASIVRVRGGIEALTRAQELLEPCACLDESGIADLERLVEVAGLSDRLVIDFSLMGSFGYYTGMVFAAYLPGLGVPLGNGGRYDQVFERYGAPRAAVGFSLSLETIQAALDRPARGGARRLRVAISKGSLFEGALDLLTRAGLDVSALANPGRQLIIGGPDDIEYIIVRPTDAPAFVAFGGADCGICGKDSLFEANLDVLEMLDLRYGGCRFVVAEPEGARERVEENYRRLGSIRVATKYPRITRDYYNRRGVTADILKFHGNIELAPLVGMADRIVDITATGTTLRENNLVVVDDVMHCTARLFANLSSARTDPRVNELARRLQAAVAE